jgi:hypothetical protein
MNSIIELAECRRQDFLADAARERLAKQARPGQPLAPQAKELMWGAVQTVRTSARGALDALSFHTLESSGKKSEQPMLTVAR